MQLMPTQFFLKPENKMTQEMLQDIIQRRYPCVKITSLDNEESEDKYFVQSVYSDAVGAICNNRYIVFANNEIIHIGYVDMKTAWSDAKAKIIRRVIKRLSD
jgi:hypothetical protein